MANSYDIAVRIGTVVVLCLSLGGCISYFPEPDSPNDTLLIIKADREKLTEFDYFGKYTVIIYNMAGESVKRVSFKENSTYFLVHGLPPGRYYVGKIYFTYAHNHKRGSVSDSHIVFALNQGSVTILRERFVTKIYADKTVENKYWMSKRWEPLTILELDRLVKTFQQNESLSQWPEIRY